jgi:hypothetical protein
MARPVERHSIASLPADGNGEYPWACECGVGQTEIARSDRRNAIVDHLRWVAMSEASCAGLPRGRHWYQLAVTLAHDLAGAGDGQFPEHLTMAGVRTLFVQACGMLRQLESGDPCPGCADWQRAVS